MRDYIEVRLEDIENDIDDIKNSIHTIKQKPRLLYLYGFINEKPEMIAVLSIQKLKNIFQDIDLKIV